MVTQNVQHHNSSLQYMIIEKSFSFTDLLLKKHFLYQCWKQCAA